MHLESATSTCELKRNQCYGTARGQLGQPHYPELKSLRAAPRRRSARAHIRGARAFTSSITPFHDRTSIYVLSWPRVVHKKKYAQMPVAGRRHTGSSVFYIRRRRSPLFSVTHSSARFRLRFSPPVLRPRLQAFDLHDLFSRLLFLLYPHLAGSFFQYY